MTKISEYEKKSLYSAILYYGHQEFKAGIETIKNEIAHNEELEKSLHERAENIRNIKTLIKQLLEIET